jgi:hypothetical protein
MKCSAKMKPRQSDSRGDILNPSIFTKMIKVNRLQKKKGSSLRSSEKVRETDRQLTGADL